MKIRNDYCVYKYLDPDDKTRVYYVGQGNKTRPYQKHPVTTSMKEHKSRFSPSVQKLIEKGDILPPHAHVEIIQKNMGKCEAQLLEQTLIRKHGINTNLFNQSGIGNSLLNSQEGSYTDRVYTNLRNCPKRRELYNLIYEETKSSDLNGKLDDQIFRITPEQYNEYEKYKRQEKELLKFKEWANKAKSNQNPSREFVQRVAKLVDKCVTLTDAIDQVNKEGITKTNKKKVNNQPIKKKKRKKRKKSKRKPNAVQPYSGKKRPRPVT